MDIEKVFETVAKYGVGGVDLGLVYIFYKHSRDILQKIVDSTEYLKVGEKKRESIVLEDRQTRKKLSIQFLWQSFIAFIISIFIVGIVLICEVYFK